jgi:hypothetical protein
MPHRSNDDCDDPNCDHLEDEDLTRTPTRQELHDIRRSEAEAYEHYDIVVRNLRDAAWIANHRSTFLHSVAADLQTRGYVTLRQAQAAYNIMARHNGAEEALTGGNEGAPVEAAATPEQAVHIYNGIYTLSDGVQHLTYRIHTVQNGSLAGKRIIKKQNNYGQFEGFAFLNSNGTIAVWRRYQEQAHERFIVWAKHLISMLANETVAGHFATGTSEHSYTAPDEITMLHHFNNEQVAPEEITDTTWRISLGRLCRRCNRALTTPTSIRDGIGPECSGREADETIAAEHRYNVAAPNDTAPLRRVAPRRPRANARTTSVPGRSTPLALSELGTGEVQ